MNKFYEEEWFSKVFFVVCALVLLVGFGMRNLLVLLLPFIFIGGFLVLRAPNNGEDNLLKRMFLALIFAPFLAAFIVVACSNPQNAWFDHYTTNQWVTIFTGVLIYTGTMTLGFVSFWQNKKLRDTYQKDTAALDTAKLSFVTLYARDGEKVDNLPLPGDSFHDKQLVIPINTKTSWVKIPCYLKNESHLPVVSIGLEALNEEIKGTRSMDHSLLIPPHVTVVIELYVPVTKAKNVDIKCSFKNVLGFKTMGLLHLEKREDSYNGVYNLSVIDTENNAVLNKK
ncbi:MAG: hypothetical protein RR614_00135 [Eubacterium sp.]